MRDPVPRRARGSSAIARAARFFMPPETSDGSLSIASSRPTSRSFARAIAWMAPTGSVVHSSSASSTFSPRVIPPKSAPSWNMTPNGGSPRSRSGGPWPATSISPPAARRARRGSASTSTFPSRFRREWRRSHRCRRGRSGPAEAPECILPPLRPQERPSVAGVIGGTSRGFGGLHRHRYRNDSLLTRCAPACKVERASSPPGEVDPRRLRP